MAINLAALDMFREARNWTAELPVELGDKNI